MSPSSDTAPHDNKNWWAGVKLTHAPSLLAAVTLFALMVMAFSDVVMRSVFNAPIEAATELTRLFMGIIVFSSLPMVSWRSEHITVDLFDGFFSRTAARIRDIAIDLACGAMLIWPAMRVWQLAMRALEDGDVTEYLGIPQVYIASFIAASTLVTATLLILRAFMRMFTPYLLPAKENKTLPLD